MSPHDQEQPNASACSFPERGHPGAALEALGLSDPRQDRPQARSIQARLMPQLLREAGPATLAPNSSCKMGANAISVTEGFFFFSAYVIVMCQAW